MRQLLSAAVVSLLVTLLIGCGSDDNPSGPGGTTFRDTTYLSAADSSFVTKLNASSYTNPAYYSLDSMSTALSKISATSGDWDLALLRYTINLNGGASSENGGTVVGAKLNTTDFDAVTSADTADAQWASDTAKLIVDNWYDYNFQTHVLSMNDYVYTMVDAEGDNFIKFKIDSLIGPGQASMGTVKLVYVYNPSTGQNSLTGTPDTALINVGGGTGYFDFSSGSQVTPVSPGTSTGWDISFSNYEVRINGGVSGPGKCAAFPAYEEISNPADFDGLTAHPAQAPMFSDYNNSIFNGDINDSARVWYEYDDIDHSLVSKNFVYLIKTEMAIYKLQIQSYYANVNDVVTSGLYTFRWKQL